jgi:hypothetical protein
MRPNLFFQFHLRQCPPTGNILTDIDFHPSINDRNNEDETRTCDFEKPSKPKDGKPLIFSQDLDRDQNRTCQYSEQPNE